MSGQIKEITSGGYQMGHASSAMQKSIRRGMEVEAMYWALELNTNFPLYVWRRLATIASEDVGLGDLSVVNTVLLLKAEVEKAHKHGRAGAKEAYEKKKRKGINSGYEATYEEHYLGLAVLALCRAKKSREADDFANEVLRRIRTSELRLEVPDFAYDKHTDVGKRKGRGIDHFWEVGALLENESHDSKYNGYDPQTGDGYNNREGKKVGAWDNRKQSGLALDWGDES